MSIYDNPLVSIIVPVYNPGQYFRKCLDTLCNQTYKNIEIILIDDGSKDGSSEICDEYVNNDSRIICIHNENHGVSSSRNTGLKLAKGDFIAFVDSDDYVENNTYERLIEKVNNNDCDAIVFEYYINYPDKEIRHLLNKENYGFFSKEETQKKLFTGFQFSVTKFLKKELITGITYREEIYRGEDTLFVAEALFKANKVLFTNEAFYHYVQSEESACRGVFRPSQMSILKLYEEYKRLYQESFHKVYEQSITYLHDNLIAIYFDLYNDINSHQYKNERKEIVSYLRQYYPVAIKSIENNFKRRIKFFIATYFPTFFCLLHKLNI